MLFSCKKTARFLFFFLKMSKFWAHKISEFSIFSIEIVFVQSKTFSKTAVTVPLRLVDPPWRGFFGPKVGGSYTRRGDYTRDFTVYRFFPVFGIDFFGAPLRKLT